MIFFFSDECIFDFFILLHFLVPPTSFANNKACNPAMWRFSIKNSQDYTLAHYLTYAEFQECSDKLDEKNRNKIK